VPVDVELNPSGDQIRIDTEWRYKELCKGIPGATWSVSEKMWRAPLAWSTCLALRSVFKSELRIGPRLTEWATNELNTAWAAASTKMYQQTEPETETENVFDVEPENVQ
jgi:hypothetical protein